MWLAVKPQFMAEALADVRPAITANHLVVSIAAGVTLAALREGLGSAPRLVRVMPNTPCLIGRGASAYCLGPGASEADGQLVGELLGCVGWAAPAPEKLLDAVTGLSGSGPAFVYLMIEALSDGGVLMGLPRELATALAAQTVAGAAHMVLETGQHPGVLKDQVTSPGGTTIAGLRALEEHGARAAFVNAVRRRGAIDRIGKTLIMTSESHVSVRNPRGFSGREPCENHSVCRQGTPHVHF